MKQALTYTLAAFLIISLILPLEESFDLPQQADEYVFTRLTYNLPSYYTCADWIRVDHPAVHWEHELICDTIFDDAYSTEVWVHPPGASILAWPLVRLVGVYDSHFYLRMFAIISFIVSLAFIYLSLGKLEFWKKLVCFTPIALMPYAVWGAGHFYHDTFMILMLSITCYLVSRNSKWRYLAACIMVLTKLPAFGFLVPLAIWSKRIHSSEAFDLLRPRTWLCWKMLLPGLALVPYLLVVWSVTGNPLYLIHHWQTMSYWVERNLPLTFEHGIFPVFLRGGYHIYLPILLASIWKFRVAPHAMVFGLAGLVLVGWMILLAYHMTQLLLWIPIMMSTIYRKDMYISQRYARGA